MEKILKDIYYKMSMNPTAEWFILKIKDYDVKDTIIDNVAEIVNWLNKLPFIREAKNRGKTALIYLK